MRNFPSRHGFWLVPLLLLASPAPAAGPPVAAITTAAAPTAAPEGDFRWPVDPPVRLTRRFDPPAQPWEPGHRGVDLAAVPGAPVRAAGAGTVLFAGAVADRPVISVAHADGLRTTYEPVTATVAVGDPVRPGQPIGVLHPGHAGCPVAACLHWGLRRGATYLDPLGLVGLGRARLLPP
jgi:murein DD-endopeptidase MepM/ murein hydrolase activator NlpD